MAEKATIEGELRVKEILKERGIKMKDFAKLMEIAPETLTRAIKGNPQYSTLKSIADFLNVPVKELFKSDDIQLATQEVHGCIFMDNQAFVFNSRRELDEILNQDNNL
jgi:transcriptional regulator with XRE-family HTH domain